MALQHARARKCPHRAIRIKVDFGDSGFNIGERDRTVLVKKIAQQKSGPGITGSWVGYEKHIILKHRRASSRDLSTGQNPASRGERP